MHTVAYFADALAPIWNIPVLESRLLKKVDVPSNPEIQADIDSLVGRGVLMPSSVHYLTVSSGRRIDAKYALNPTFSARILAAISSDEQFSRELSFVLEVTLALSGLGISGMNQAVLVDATYSDPLVDFGSVVDLSPEDAQPTRTVQVSQRFTQLMASERALSDAELTHLYVRHLYGLIGADDDAL
ncbi:hypothetical protein SK854_17640 [Lentzea sp. BCCO 10_0061]|uniref:Uncharacterized protein n=1 Tax=Lentzea sokolovensis TaxID=3095429 RepID=A0ABU4UWX1_9PSEU|nr:hypothetical protein [Lentzea sp. BCCO 10_0061]MDX8143946.1 hypothetical protein [Lentzea sp. BCCO 10_0061]